MNLTPGDRVRWATKDLKGTVLNDHCDDWPDFVPVQWDDGSRTYSAPTHIKALKSGDVALGKVDVTAKESNNQKEADSCE